MGTVSVTEYSPPAPIAITISQCDIQYNVCIIVYTCTPIIQVFQEFFELSQLAPYIASDESGYVYFVWV